MAMKLVVFDVDGTLIDSLAHIRAAMGWAFEACALPHPSPEAIQSIIGLSLPQAMLRLVPGLSEVDLGRLVQAYKASFASSARTEQEPPLFDGAREALERLSARDDLVLAIATGKSRRGLSRMVERHGIKQHFVSLQVADDHPSKPHPSMVEQCLNDSGAAPEDAVIIGDTTYDLEMGRAAGIGTIGVRWGYHPVPELEPWADHIIEQFSDLDATLDMLWSRR